MGITKAIIITGIRKTRTIRKIRINARMLTIMAQAHRTTQINRITRTNIRRVIMINNTTKTIKITPITRTGAIIRRKTMKIMNTTMKTMTPASSTRATKTTTMKTLSRSKQQPNYSQKHKSWSILMERGKTQIRLRNKSIPTHRDRPTRTHKYIVERSSNRRHLSSIIKLLKAKLLNGQFLI